MKEMISEDFTWQIVDPIFDKSNLFIYDIVERLTFREETVHKRAAMLIGTSFIHG